MKCSCVWPLTYHLGLRVEKNPNKKANAVILCWSTASFKSQIKDMVTLVSFQGLINSKSSIPITFKWVSSPAGHNPRGGGGTLGISGWGCAAGTLEPLTYTRDSSAEFCHPILE